ncbi:unnamed protein product [Rhizophagus irregularis]|nr:unnamed protein product [Rhizophagus irregularis]
MVVQQIFSITVSTALLEQLFSTMGWYHSKWRNRLKAEKVLSLAQIRASSDTDSETNEYDNESINNIYTQPLASANEWRKTVIDWIEMIENELQDQDNELASITYTYDISIENIEQIQHSAIDPQAKWKLKNIFIENLELPGYLEDFIIGKA